MDWSESRYWPFDVVPPEQRTERAWQVIWFLETAHEAGYKPYAFDTESYGASAGARSAEIVYRGQRGKHRQVFLAEDGEMILSAHVDDFGQAIAALMRWLGGATGVEILDQLRDHLIANRATGPGFVLREPQEDRSEPAPLACGG